MLAARFTGLLKNASKKASKVNFIVITDTDILSDRLWVSENNLYGESVFNAQASNGDFFSNIIDELSGSDDLISIRSRGMVSRPFTKVDQIRRISELKYRDSQAQLLLNLETLQTKINKIQETGQKPEDLLKNPEYKALITEKIKLRKNLRRIQQGMNEQVEQLGRNIKLLNIFLIPIILLIIAFVVFIRRRMPQNYSRVRRDTI